MTSPVSFIKAATLDACGCANNVDNKSCQENCFYLGDTMESLLFFVDHIRDVYMMCFVADVMGYVPYVGP